MKKMCNFKKEEGHEKILKKGLKMGFKFTDKVLEDAVETGHFECVKFILATGQKPTSKLCAIATFEKEKKILQFLHKNYFEACNGSCERAKHNRKLQSMDLPIAVRFDD